MLDSCFLPSRGRAIGVEPSSDYTLIELTGTNRFGLPSEVSAVLTNLECNVVNAEVWTHNKRATAVIQGTDRNSGLAISDVERLVRIKERLCNVFKGRSRDAKTMVAMGITHTERRLHQMMLEDRDYERFDKDRATIRSVPYRGSSTVERKNCRCGRYPPEVRTSVPTEGRFEHVVLSCNATADHGIIWIEREAQKALDLMEQEEELTSPPSQQKMLRAQEAQSLDLEEGAIGLHSIEHLVLLEEGIPQVSASSSTLDFHSPRTSTMSCNTSSSSSSIRSEQPEWDELVETFLADHEQGGDQRRRCMENLCSIFMGYLPSRYK